MATGGSGANTNNRDQRPARSTARYRSHVGRWTASRTRASPSARTGRSTDGQHRLEAIAKSGVGVWMLVVRGLMPESRADIDSGEKRLTNDSPTIVDGVAGQHTDARSPTRCGSCCSTTAPGAVVQVHDRDARPPRASPGIAAIHRAMPSSVRSINRRPGGRSSGVRTRRGAGEGRGDGRAASTAASASKIATRSPGFAAGSSEPWQPTAPRRTIADTP